jgi:signal transduction histidine kinase
MNAMLARLESAATRQQQFIGDASHELRGPLTALQTQIDVAIAHPSDPETSQVLPKIRQQVTRMTMLIEDLLFLARSTETTRMVLPAPVDLDEVVLTEVNRLRDLGDLTVQVDSLHAARVQGSFRDLTRMLRNLGDNAYDHAASTISFVLTTDRDTAEITVTDDGPGIAVEDREKIFDRFSRLDDARTRNTRGGGSGLGLSIARDVAKTSGGTLSVYGRPDGEQGAVFLVRIPLSE